VFLHSLNNRILRGTKVSETPLIPAVPIPLDTFVLTLLAWAAYWSPIFQSLTMQCINPCRDIRHHAISSLQRSLLSLELTSKDHNEWTAIFDEVLFPLILRLLKPEVYHSDTMGMSETRVQAATVVCKIFLRYLDQLPDTDRMLDLWLKILDILDRMINSGQGDSLVCPIFPFLNDLDHVAWIVSDPHVFYRRKQFQRASRISF
jgi:hypothetical protein